MVDILGFWTKWSLGAAAPLTFFAQVKDGVVCADLALVAGSAVVNEHLGLDQHGISWKNGIWGFP